MGFSVRVLGSVLRANCSQVDQNYMQACRDLVNTDPKKLALEVVEGIPLVTRTQIRCQSVFVRIMFSPKGKLDNRDILQSDGPKHQISYDASKLNRSYMIGIYKRKFKEIVLEAYPHFSEFDRYRQVSYGMPDKPRSLK